MALQAQTPPHWVLCCEVFGMWGRGRWASAGAGSLALRPWALLGQLGGKLGRGRSSGNPRWLRAWPSGLRPSGVDGQMAWPTLQPGGVWRERLVRLLGLLFSLGLHRNQQLLLTSGASPSWPPHGALSCPGRGPRTAALETEPCLTLPEPGPVLSQVTAAEEEEWGSATHGVLPLCPPLGGAWRPGRSAEEAVGRVGPGVPQCAVTPGCSLGLHRDPLDARVGLQARRWDKPGMDSASFTAAPGAGARPVLQRRKVGFGGERGARPFLTSSRRPGLCTALRPSSWRSPAQ